MSNSAQNPESGCDETGRFEFLAMNNPLRRIIQEHIEFKTFNKFLEKRKYPASWKDNSRCRMWFRVQLGTDTKEA